MKIFITGATGYIGTSLVHKLADEGHELNLLVRSKNNSGHLKRKGVTLYYGDILNKYALDLAMQGCCQVYHLAALAKVWIKNPNNYFDINLLGTKNVLEAARKNGIQKMVFCSTAGVYGASLKQEITEESLRTYDFSNEYESSKALAESLVKDYIIKNKMHIVIASPTRVYGPSRFHPPTLVNLMISKYLEGKWKVLPGNGRTAGNYVYIDDVVQGMVLCMENGRNGNTYLLAGENHSMRSFFNTLAHISGKYHVLYKIPLWLVNIAAYVQFSLAELFSIEPSFTHKWLSKTRYDWKVAGKKAVQSLGLRQTTLEDGLKKTVNWLRKETYYS